jgi:3-isopropylmalate/(R)-2-methylmalate dehydratase large subunit
MPDTSEAPLTLCDKIWNAHVVGEAADGRTLVHIDRHILHEVSSAQAFVNLRRSGRRVRNPELTFATIDHIVSTAPGRTGTTFAGGAELVEFLRKNCVEYGIRLFDLSDPRQGIVHVFAPETGLCLPGCTLVCSDSHTATVGGLGVLAWGVGASEAEHVLATQTVARARPKTMRIRFDGSPSQGTSAKDIILHLIRRLGTDAGTGYVVEYAGAAIRALPVEGRMTVCNMSVEFGARAGLIAPDERVYEYLHGREFAPKEAVWDRALAHWRTLTSDDEARFDREEAIDCNGLAPQVSWGTSPQDVIDVDGRVPAPDAFADPARRQAAERAIAYMGLEPGAAIEGLPVDVVFIGSCTNGRLSDLTEAARIADGRKVKPGVRAVVVPGSRAVKNAAETAGLDRVFRSAGFEWREPGCSMCVSINDDRVGAGQRCVSTTNRNFQGRQGDGSRTHLASPATAAASAIAGAVADPRKMMM